MPVMFKVSATVCRLLAFFVLCASVPVALCQSITPHIGYVYPAGGRQGTSFQVKVGGQFLDGATNVFISGPGIQARVLQHTKPMTQKQFNDLREQMKELQNKRTAAARKGKRGAGAQGSARAVWTAEDDRAFAEIRKKLAGFVRRPMNPAIAEILTLQVTAAPEAEPGEREVRIRTSQGLSNPLTFCIGQLPEAVKKEVKNNDDLQTVFKKFRNPDDQGASPPTETRITIPGVANGQVMAGGVDRFRFAARQGQRLVIAALARQLIPYLADAVPGWFQATLGLYDSKGKELAYDDDFRFNPDPVVYFEVPKDGEYLVEIKDSIYRGREDFVYRIEISEAPFITSIFPLGGKAGTETKVELKGWNLPTTSVAQDLKNKPVGLCPISVSKDGRVSNPMPFAVDTLPEGLEQEPNDAQPSARAISLPLIINGRIDKPGDVDVFQFTGSAGQEIVADVSARKLNSPLDSVLKLTDATGKKIALNDDCEDKGCGLTTHHADSRIAVTLPASGTYYLCLADAQNKGGLEYAYRLRVSQPRPDFELRVVPSSISLRPGVSVPLTVYALRKDGYSNQISLALADAPAGFSLSGAMIPANQDQVRITLGAPSRADGACSDLVLEGRGMIQGKAVVRQALPAEDMMQAFAYRHLVPARELKAVVSGRSFGRSPATLLTEGAVKIPLGGTARVRIAAPLLSFSDRVQLELSEPPDGITIERITPGRDGTDVVIHSDEAKTKLGLKGNLIITAMSKPPGAGKAKAAANQRRVQVGTLPAIQFEIVAR